MTHDDCGNGLRKLDGVRAKLEEAYREAVEGGNPLFAARVLRELEQLAKIMDQLLRCPMCDRSQHANG